MNLTRDVILSILQIITLYNARVLGWSIEKIGENTYELTKNVDCDIDLSVLLNDIVSFTKVL